MSTSVSPFSCVFSLSCLGICYPFFVTYFFFLFCFVHQKRITFFTKAPPPSHRPHFSLFLDPLLPAVRVSFPILYIRTQRSPPFFPWWAPFLGLFFRLSSLFSRLTHCASSRSKGGSFLCPPNPPFPVCSELTLRTRCLLFFFPTNLKPWSFLFFLLYPPLPLRLRLNVFFTYPFFCFPEWLLPGAPAQVVAVRTKGPVSSPLSALRLGPAASLFILFVLRALRFPKTSLSFPVRSRPPRARFFRPDLPCSRSSLEKSSFKPARQ